MKAVFLCAGYGTRLYPLTVEKPKPLLPIAGEALLTHLLRKLESIASIDQVVVVSNDRFYRHFCDWQAGIRTSKRVTVLNDGTKDPEHRLGAIQDLKLGWCHEGSDTDLLAFAGDNLFDADLFPFISFAESMRPGACVGVYDVKDRNLAQKYGLIKTDTSGKIIAFFEKPKDPPTTRASMGIYFLPKETFQLMDRYLKANQNPDAPGYYIGWLSKETNVFAYRFSGTWFDIGDLDSYQRADEFLKAHGKSRTK